MKDNNIYEVVFGALIGLGSYFCGLNWELIIIWFVLMILDITSGIICAAKKGVFSSKEMKAGLFKKTQECFLLIALILGQRVAQLCGIGLPVSHVFVGLYCLKELSSIIENSIGMDIKIPEFILKWFKNASTTIENLPNNSTEVKK